MNTVKALINALSNLPGDTVVKVAVADIVGYGTSVDFVDLDFTEHFDYIDLSDNPFANDKQKEGPPVLHLGLT